MTRRLFPRRRGQRGLSLVEMMVGVAVGLIVVAGATMLVSTQLVENRRLLIETQLQQDLRAAADIISRELRRTGAQRDLLALKGIWYPGMTNTEHNTFAESLSPSTGLVMYNYQPPAGLDNLLGFKLENNTIKQQLASGNGWQELTDPNVLRVTDFVIEPADSNALQLPCPKLCSDGTSDCWPKVQVRGLKVTITGQAANNVRLTGVQRTIVSQVRLRNDYVRFFNPSANQVCPS
jgi:type IV pilus assembly protein PilW